MRYNKNIFLNNIESLMKEKEIRISELENNCGLSQGYFSRFKSSDETAAPSVNLIIKLCDVFNVSINMLLFTECSSLCRQEKTLIDFLDKISERTYLDNIHWKKYNLSSNYDDIVNSGITSFLIPCKAENSFRFKSKFNEYRFLDFNSEIYTYKNENDYFVLCNIRDDNHISSNFCEPDLILELYYIKNNIVHTMSDSINCNKYISKKIEYLYECILKEQSAVRIDDDVLKAITNF